jgi:alpha-acetolactate decarboxylase
MVGLGRFEGLDGEIVVLDGRIYQAKGDGTVLEAPDDADAPFAVVTQFEPDQKSTLARIADLADLAAQCDLPCGDLHRRVKSNVRSRTDRALVVSDTTARCLRL